MPDEEREEQEVSVDQQAETDPGANGEGASVEIGYTMIGDPTGIHVMPQLISRAGKVDVKARSGHVPWETVVQGASRLTFEALERAVLRRKILVQ